MQVVDEKDVIKTIYEKVDEAGSQKKLAERWGISQAFLSDVLNGNRPISPKILGLLGLERAIVRSKP